MEGAGCTSFGLMDIAGLVLVFLYFRAPIQRIEDTALLMDAWGRDGATWKRRMIRQYWVPPVIYTAFLIGIVCLYHYFKLPPEAPEWEKFKVAYWLWWAMIPLWPFVMCIRANRAYSSLEEWHQAQIEHRIAAGMASPADYYGYIQSVKEREYNRGYSAGKMFSKW